MKISVIIPTYKPQNYLWECLDSLKNQTFPKEMFEIILVLNGCREPYEKQIKGYIIDNLSCCNIKYLQTDEGGVSNARNLALNVAAGEYITFIDDDDFVSSCYLEELYNSATPKIVSISNALAVIDDNLTNNFSFTLSKEYAKKYKNGIQPLSNARRFFAGPWMKLIHKDIIRDCRFDKSFKNGEDSIYMFLISDMIEAVNFTPPEAIYYRRYRENSAVTQRRTIYQRAYNAFRMIWEYIKIYISRPQDYSLCFFCTRILGTLKSIFFIA